MLVGLLAGLLVIAGCGSEGKEGAATGCREAQSAFLNTRAVDADLVVKRHRRVVELCGPGSPQAERDRRMLALEARVGGEAGSHRQTPGPEGGAPEVVGELLREADELTAKVQAVEAEGARAQRLMWRAGDRGCYPCAESYRRQLHDSGDQLDRLRLRIGSVTRRARALLEQVGAQP